MEKRGFTFGTYDTAAKLWTLAGWTFPEPEYQQHFVEVPGGMPLDFSTALTDGEPTYGTRILTVTLESSEGSRLEREDRISEMVNALDGRRMEIVLPDRPGLYASGRLQVKKEYNNLVHGAVIVTAICDPWLYYKAEKIYTITATSTKKVVALTNRGRRRAVPVVAVSAGSTVLLEFGGMTYSLTAGQVQLPDLTLPQGDTLLTYSGSGMVQIIFREAML